ncbi:MAG: hypothetical protein KatS3mg105_2620 [Gemmatales bacterium]|nr:MAG: hypothetical protein KatS3mg105_2620 [Gemmatales bacterium]
MLTLTATPDVIKPGKKSTSTITADLLSNNLGEDTSAGPHFDNSPPVGGLPLVVTFTTDRGSLEVKKQTAVTNPLINRTAETLFLANTKPGMVNLTAAFDNETVLGGLQVAKGKPPAPKAENIDLQIFRAEVIDPNQTQVEHAQTWVDLDDDDLDGVYDNKDTRIEGITDNELVRIKLVSKTNKGTISLVPLSPDGKREPDRGNDPNFHVRFWTSGTRFVDKGEPRTRYDAGTPLKVAEEFEKVGNVFVKTLWVEGVTEHTDESPFTILRMTHSETKEQDDVKITVLGLKSIEWVGRGNSVNDDNTLDKDPNFVQDASKENPQELVRGGLRVFPGARLVNGQVEANPRNTVGVKVTLSVKPVEPVKVFFKAFDVDDPSFEEGPVDSNDAGNPGTAPQGDNRDSANPTGKFLPDANNGKKVVGEVLEKEFADKTGEFTFQVPMQPGDNIRIVANGDSQILNFAYANNDAALNQGATVAERNINKQKITHDNQDLSKPIKDREMQQPDKYASKVLTVWRRLYVEVDDMGRVAGNTVRGQTVRVFADPDKSKQQTTILTDVVFQDREQVGNVNRFQGGKFTQDVGGRQRVFDVIDSNFVGNRLVLRVKNIGNVRPIQGRAFTLVDDDVRKDGEQVQAPDTSTLAEAMRPAYVHVDFLKTIGNTSTTDDDATFSLNLEFDAGKALSARFWDSRNLNADNFWVAYVVGAFQGPTSEDADPDRGEGSTTTGEFLAEGPKGQPPEIGHGAFIYKEVVRDIAAQIKVDVKLLEQDTVVHEVAHAVARSGDHPVTLAGAELGAPMPSIKKFKAGLSIYLPKYIALIRSSPKPLS